MSAPEKPRSTPEAVVRVKEAGAAVRTALDALDRARQSLGSVRNAAQQYDWAGRTHEALREFERELADLAECAGLSLDSEPEDGADPQGGA